MDWLCKPFDIVLHDQLTKYYGEIDIYLTKEKILAQLTSGNLQVVLYDLTEMKVLIAYGYQTKEGQKVNAFESHYVELNMTKLFNEQKPSFIL